MKIKIVDVVYDSAVAVLEIVVLVVELDVLKFGDVVPCNTLVTSRELSMAVSIWWL